MDNENRFTSITKDPDPERYQIWPYRAEPLSAGGDRNNGGLDLVANPELIELIHEATEENGLRPLLVSMNSQDKTFMTLGCLAELSDGAYYSYLEFTPRNPEVARNENAIKDVYQQWLDWLLAGHCDPHPGLADALRQSVVWEYREFSFRESDPQYLITVYPRASSARDHGSLVSWLHQFLSDVTLDHFMPNPDQ